jgi:hypothetical protein
MRVAAVNCCERIKIHTSLFIYERTARLPANENYVIKFTKRQNPLKVVHVRVDNLTPSAAVAVCYIHEYATQV